MDIDITPEVEVQPITEARPQAQAKLPLWERVVEKLREQHLTYGQAVDVGWLEVELKCFRDSMEFSLAVSRIRRALEENGLYLTGRKQQGKRLVVLPPDQNRIVLQGYALSASDALFRAVTLGNNTDLTLLDDVQKRKHTATLERVAVKAILLRRATPVVKVIKKHAPDLLNP